MTDLRLAIDDRARLLRLIGQDVRQLVWDMNAIYFVGEGATIKLAADMRSPPSPTFSEFAEAACLSAEEDPDAGPFLLTHEEKYWYQVVAENVQIFNLERVRTGFLMPAEQLWRLNDPPPAGSVLSECDCGLLVTTSEGLLPAVQTHNAYGFMNWPFVGLYERDEAIRILTNLDNLYDVLPL